MKVSLTLAILAALPITVEIIYVTLIIGVFMDLDFAQVINLCTESLNHWTLEYFKNSRISADEGALHDLIKGSFGFVIIVCGRYLVNH